METLEEAESVMGMTRGQVCVCVCVCVRERERERARAVRLAGGLSKMSPFLLVFSRILKNSEKMGDARGRSHPTVRCGERVRERL